MCKLKYINFNSYKYIIIYNILLKIYDKIKVVNYIYIIIIIM